jgi:hypothetical protein
MNDTQRVRNARKAAPRCISIPPHHRPLWSGATAWRASSRSTLLGGLPNWLGHSNAKPRSHVTGVRAVAHRQLRHNRSECRHCRWNATTYDHSDSLLRSTLTMRIKRGPRETSSLPRAPGFLFTAPTGHKRPPSRLRPWARSDIRLMPRSFAGRSKGAASASPGYAPSVSPGPQQLGSRPPAA